MQTNLTTINTSVLTDILYHNQVPILSYEINYPQFYTDNPDHNLDILNTYYLEKAYSLEYIAKKNLLPLAIEQYDFSMEHDYPVMKYEIRQDYQITENQKNLISLYYDQYQFSGGAHGSTTRYSNTWDVNTGNIMTLKNFFPTNPNYKQDIIDAINQYISTHMVPDQTTYFDDYRQLVTTQFNEHNFYLTPEGIVVYFQQYDISPYSSGIPQFLIPYAR